MFKKLFGLGKKEVQQDPRDLLKKATSKKKEGKFNEAILLLKRAYQEIAKGNINHGINPFLRLPNYLQEVGKPDEAWGEYNRLLNNGYPNQLNDFSVVTMEHSKIYDKMRLFLQRENKNEKAVTFGILSDLAWARGLNLQKRNSELKTYSKTKNIKDRLQSLLKKANLENEIEAFVLIVSTELNDPNNIDLNRVSKKVNTVVSAA
ncbi:MAG: hypothetical protein WD053_04085 [Gracilimonas sp.]